MNGSNISKAVSPWILLLDGSPGSAYEFTWRCVEAGFTARVLRGAKMRSGEALFDELGAALQFPDYFGENWPAVAECLADLAWMPPGAGYVLMITDAALVLSEEPPDQIGVLVRMLTSVASSWAIAVDDGEWWDRPAVPFHVVLQVDRGAMALIRSKWSAAGELPIVDG